MTVDQLINILTEYKKPKYEGHEVSGNTPVYLEDIQANKTYNFAAFERGGHGGECLLLSFSRNREAK